MSATITYLEDLERTRNSLDAQIERIKAARAKYPDLRVRKSEDPLVGRAMLCSKLSNSKVTEIYTQHCAHCEFSPLTVRLYHSDRELNDDIHSDPPTFVVSHRPGGEESYGEVPEAGWKERMEKAGIPGYIIMKVDRFINGHPPVQNEESP